VPAVLKEFVTMKRLVQFSLGNNETILVEVDEPLDSGRAPDGDVPRGMGAAELAQKAGQTFESAISKIKPLAGAVIAKLRELQDSPEEVSVEFGIKLSAEAGVLLASSSVEANFKIAATWKKHP
jgi:hypothetical protein